MCFFKQRRQKENSQKGLKTKEIRGQLAYWLSYVHTASSIIGSIHPSHILQVSRQYLRPEADAAYCGCHDLLLVCVMAGNSSIFIS